MKLQKQKYYFVNKLTIQQLIKLDDMRARIFVCSDEAGKPFGFLVKLTPRTISFLKSHHLTATL